MEYWCVSNHCAAGTIMWLSRHWGLNCGPRSHDGRVMEFQEQPSFLNVYLLPHFVETLKAIYLHEIRPVSVCPTRSVQLQELPTVSRGIVTLQNERLPVQAGGTRRLSRLSSCRPAACQEDHTVARTQDICCTSDEEVFISSRISARSAGQFISPISGGAYLTFVLPGSSSSVPSAPPCCIVGISRR